VLFSIGFVVLPCEVHKHCPSNHDAYARRRDIVQRLCNPRTASAAYLHNACCLGPLGLILTAVTAVLSVLLNRAQAKTGRPICPKTPYLLAPIHTHQIN
jgi:hypothetical protein